MKLYNLHDLNAILKKSKLLYCSNDLNYGIELKLANSALKSLYVQANNEKVIKLLVIDLDHSNPMIWEEVGVAAPNFIVRDRLKNTSHLIYVLENFITKDYQRFGKALDYFSKIQHEYTKLLKGDPGYAGLITKNPNNEHWATSVINPFYFYNLNELADYVQLPGKIVKEEAIGEGRNCYLFHAVRKWAYGEVLFYKKNQANQSIFYNVVLNKLENLNHFENSPSLGFNELKNIAKSISNWTWEKFSEKGFFEAQRRRREKRTKKQKEIKEKILEGIKNEL